MYFERIVFASFLGIKKKSIMLKIHCKKIDFQNYTLECSKAENILK